MTEEAKHYQVYDKQRKKFRRETNESKKVLMEQFRDIWYEVNYDSEYTDIIQSDLDESATQEEVETVMHQRVYGISAEKYLKLNGFEIREVISSQ